MMEIKSPGSKTIYIKDKWEELTPKEYLFVVKLLAFASMGKFDIDEFQEMYLMFIAGYKPSRLRSPEVREEINSNIYMLSQQIDFFFRKNEKGRTEFNINFTKNLLPEFRFNHKKYTGPEFYLSDLGDVRTNLKAKPFIDAQEYYNLYLQTQNTEALNMLVAVLYGNYKNGYTTFEAQKQGEKLVKLDFNIKYGVYTFFRALLHLITTRTHLGILFRKHKKDNSSDDKISLGLSETVYSLIKSGYGSEKEIGNMLFTKYLEALLKELKDSIQNAIAAGKKPFDIAKDRGIPFEIINQLS
ncbi:MAG: hypothetical protein JEY96_01520 [Bacteroidales bacterium]|nr:hypothetical protein [Bacteroidales bacterium]